MSIQHRQGPPPEWIDKQPYFLLGKSSDQSFNSTVLTKTTWETEVITPTFFDIDLTNNRIFVPANAKYQFNTRIASVSNNFNDAHFHLFINGISVEELTADQPFNDGAAFIFTDIILLAGDFVEIFGQQDSGMTRTWQATGSANGLDSGFEGRMII